MNKTKRYQELLVCAVIGILVACGGDGSKEIPVEFSISGAKGRIQGNQVTIDLAQVESCSSLTNLSLVVDPMGNQITPDPSTVKDFSSPVTFTLTSENGEKTDYVVTVVANPCAGGTTPAQTTNKPPPQTACLPEPAAASGYSLVFRGCDSNNLPTYYDKTECVRDNATGLMWEGKTTAGLRASENRYNNLDNAGLPQVSSRFSPFTGSIPARTPTQAEIEATDNSVGYQAQVNASNLCGYSDWRVPTRDELLSLRVPGSTTLIDFVWFPNTDWNGLYATSTQFGAQIDQAWVVQFYERGINRVDTIPRDGTIFHPTLGSLSFRNHAIRLVR
jgi:hypothetical protein